MTPQSENKIFVPTENVFMHKSISLMAQVKSKTYPIYLNLKGNLMGCLNGSPILKR